MAKQPSGRRILLNLFDQLEQPVYLLDGERRLVYGNAACFDWLGAAEADVIGQVCHYHCDPSLDARPMAGLCPPPSMFDDDPAWAIRVTHDAAQVGHAGNPGDQAFGTVWASRGTVGISRRSATFVRLKDSSASSAILVRLAAADLPEPTDGIKSEPTEAANLHDALMAIRAKLTTGMKRVLVGRHPRIAHVRRQVAVAEAAGCAFTVVGRCGVGAREVAQQIVERRRQATGHEWFPIECQLLEGDLLLSAIDVAATQHARCTLLFLDIDRLGPESQVSLWRAIAAHGDRLGIAATSSTNLVDASAFHQELALRLSLIVIRLPSIGERRSDVPFLVQDAIERHNAEGRHRQVERAGRDVIDLLTAHPWSDHDGQQLEEIVSQACLNCQGTVINIGDLPPIIQLTADAKREPRVVRQAIDLDAYLLSIERELIARAVDEANGNRAQAARLLSISRARLLRRLELFQSDKAPVDSKNRQSRSGAADHTDGAPS